MKNDKARLAIDFTSRAALADFVERAKQAGLLPEGSVAYEMDALDKQSGGGVTPHNTYLVRRVGDRPERFRLNVEETTTSTV
jgi:hypothetical protein